MKNATISQVKNGFIVYLTDTTGNETYVTETLEAAKTYLDAHFYPKKVEDDG